MFKPLMSATLLTIITLLVACGGGGGGGGGAGIPKGKLAITVLEDDGITPIADAYVDVIDNTNDFVAHGVTDADGQVSFSLMPGTYSARIQAQGFAMSPPRGVGALPVTVENRQTASVEYELAALGDPTADSIIRGNADYPGLLVVAEDSTQGIAVSGISDSSGDYVLFNVVPGNYSVKAFRSGFESNAVGQVITGGQDVTVNLAVVPDISATLSGQITFLATANGIVDVTLLHPVTLDSIPGLGTNNDAGLDYTMDDVPAGDYLAWATFANDGYVMDPDWVNKNGGYPAALEITMGATNQTKDFSVTDAVELVSPTNAGDDMTPAIVDTLTPTFDWSAYPSTKHYILEVFDLNGNSIWGGYTYNGVALDPTFHHPLIDFSETAKVFNFDGSASQPLEDGKTYLWRVYAFNDATPKIALSSSEQQMGLFKVVLPPP